MALSLAAVHWKRWREEQALTQAAAAARLGIDPWYLAKIEQGRRKPGRGIAVRMHDVSGGAAGVAEWDIEGEQAATVEEV